MKAIECKLILHGSCMQHDGGTHKSKAAARRFASEIDWRRPFTVIPLKPEPQPKMGYFEAMERVRQLAQMDGEAY